MPSILVTGAGGFLGRYVVSEFVGRGWRVVGIDLLPADAMAGFEGAAYFQLDVRDPTLRQLLERERPDACVHCAGSASVPLSMQRPLHDFQCNAGQTAELLEALRTAAPECALVLLSSAAVYGSPNRLPIDETTDQQPISAYGYHKRMAEQLCTEYAALHGLRTASARIFSAYGVGLRRQVLWDICRKLLGEDRVVLQGTGAESRDFVHARDIAGAVGCIVDKAAFTGESYNVASGRETSVATLAALICAALGQPERFEFDGRVPEGNPLRWRACLDRIVTLGFEPQVPLSCGVEEFVAWARTETTTS